MDNFASISPDKIYSKLISESINRNEALALLISLVEESTDGKILVGMTTNVNDVINVGYKFKIIKHILNTMGF